MDNQTTEIQRIRNSKTIRIWFMVVITLLVLGLYGLGIIKKGFAIGIGIILLAAFGIEMLNYDLDIWRLWKTWDIQESRVSHTKEWIRLIGSCAIPKSGDWDLNCANFETQISAQKKYEQCAIEIASYNENIDSNKIKSLDIYRLDGDKDGIVCESLPGKAPMIP